MSHIRVMFVGQGPTGLPVDRVVNVFHFQGGEVYADDVEEAINLVKSFYQDLQTSQLHPIGSYISAWVGREAQLIGYDMDSAPERIPFTVDFTLPAAVAASGLPNEVALCLSFEGVPPHTPRRRGRVYIGPLCQGVDEYGASSTVVDARPAAGIMGDLGLAAAAMAFGSAGVFWVIRSTKPVVNYVPVVSGWVDNAFDTQRRRGQEPTTRSTWVALGI